MNVLDASAVMALLYEEPGSDEIEGFLDRSLISTVNLAEVLQKAAHHGVSPTEVHALIGEIEIGVVPFDQEMAIATASLWGLTRHKGLSLGDRACLSLTMAVHGIAVTTDRSWAGLGIPDIGIHLVARR